LHHIAQQELTAEKGLVTPAFALSRPLRATLSASVLILSSAVMAQPPASPTPLPTPPHTPGITFVYGSAVVTAPSLGTRIELLPVLTLIGAQAGLSPAAGTYLVAHGDHVIQLSPGRRYVLIDSHLERFNDYPVMSPLGIAATPKFLDKAILDPLDLHLELMQGGYRIAPGGRFADPVGVRAAVADFASTTTLVLTLERDTPVRVEAQTGEGVVVHFEDATPQLDPTLPIRSRRVKQIEGLDQDLDVSLDKSVGLLSSHILADPPRVILELGQVKVVPTPAPVQLRPELSDPPIVIDPGHGGDDIGATSRNDLKEKDLVLAIARRLERELSRRGHTVRLTRSGDEARALTDRTALANRLEAKVFVSLHANASTVSSVRGAETYYMSLDSSATDEAAAATADVENSVASESNHTGLDLILWDLAQAEVLNESAGLALAIQQRLNQLMGLRDRGVKQAPFVILTGATMPAVLVEIGFLSNPNEAHRLGQAEHQQLIAEALASGIEEFLRGQ